LADIPVGSILIKWFNRYPVIPENYRKIERDKKMKKFLLVMFAALCCAVTSFAADECPKGWTLDINAALKKAKAENKKVYLLFTGSDWCGFCIRLKDDVFSKKDFQKIAQKSLNTALAALRRAGLTPTRVFLTDSDGSYREAEL
jgi:thioredoxin-related protein